MKKMNTPEHETRKAHLKNMLRLICDETNVKSATVPQANGIIEYLRDTDELVIYRYVDEKGNPICKP